MRNDFRQYIDGDPELYDIFLFFDSIMQDSYDLAKKYNSKIVEPFHVFLVLIDHPAVKETILQSIKQENYKKLKEEIIEYIRKNQYTENSQESSMPQRPDRILISNSVKNLLNKGVFFTSLVDKNNKELIIFDMLDNTLENDILSKLSKSIGIDKFSSFLKKDQKSRTMDSLFDYDNSYVELFKFDNGGNLKRASDSNKNNSGEKNEEKFSNNQNVDYFPDKDSNYWKFCINLNEQAQLGKLDKVINRDDEIKNLEIILLKKKKSNAVLVGAPGVGKTSIVEGLAQRIVEGNVSKKLKDYKIASLDLTAIISGTKFRGDLEERIKYIINETTRSGKIILFIDEIHRIVTDDNGGNTQDISNLLKSSLSKGGFKVIGATTEDEYARFFESDRALKRRFHKINVREPTKDETRIILSRIVPNLEDYHKVKFDVGTIDLVLNLTEKYMKDKHFPDKAIDVFDICGARVASIDEKLVKDLIIYEEISRLSGIPVENILKSDFQKIEEFRKSIKTEIYNQDSIIDELCDSLLLYSSGLKTRGGIGASFLFCGPTGVGKTELARKISQYLNRPLVKFDMSEFMEKHSVSKFIGSPPGYVGFEREGKLVSEIEKNPNAVLLLDEIEKANPEVLNILLQVMDDGIVSSSRGKKVYFHEIILIMTSNIGNSNKKNKLGFIHNKDENGNLEYDNDNDENKRNMMEEIKRYFTPEFLGRLDSILLFNEIGSKEKRRIVEKGVKEILEKMKESNIKNLENKKQNINDLVDLILSRIENEEGDGGVRKIKKIIEKEIALPFLKSKIKQD